MLIFPLKKEWYEKILDIDGKNENYADIEVRRVNVLGEKHQISLVAWRR